MSTYQKYLGNLVYHATVVSCLSLVFNIVAKTFKQVTPADLGKPDFEDALKLVDSVALAMWTQDQLEKHGLPVSIFT